MADLAVLGLEVRSDPVAQASDKLAKFSGAAKRAEESAKGFGTGASNAARRVANDNGIAAKSAAALGNAYTRLAAIITGVLAAAFSALSLRKFITATVEANQVQAQLAAALKSTGGVAGQTVSAMNAHAGALQKVTTFGDDAINSAQGLLLTFTKIRGDVFPQATKAVLNVATAMKKDLSSTALQVGKALNDPVLGMTALSRSGIQFTASQKAVVKQMVETNNIAGAQAIILKELETQFGGSAEAARKTLGGALDALRERWGDLFELGEEGANPLRMAIEGLITAISNPAFTTFVQTIGAALFGAFSMAVQGATLLVNGINLLVDNMDTIGVAAGTAGGLLAVYFAPAILGAMASGLLAVGTAGVTAMTMITAAAAANPLAAFAIAIVAAVTAAYYFRDEIQKAIGVDVVAIAKGAANLVIGSFVAAYEDIKFVWGSFPDIIAVAIMGAVNVVIAGVNAMINGAKAGINTLIATMNMIPGVDISALDTSAQTVSPISTPTISGRLGKAVDARNAAVDAAMSKDYIGGLTSEYKGATPAAQEFAGAVSAVNDSLAGSDKAAKKAAEAYKKIVEGAREFIALQELEMQALGMTEQAANALRYEQEMLNEAQRAGITLTSSQKGELGALAGQMAATEAATLKAKEALEFGRETVGGFVNDLKQGLMAGEGFWKSFGNAALNVINKIADKLMSGVLDSLFQVGGSSTGSSGGGWLSGLFAGAKKLFGFASGGYTGDGPANQAKGVVHGGEYVFNKAATSRIGLSNLERLHKGYAIGGYVGQASPRMQSPANDSRPNMSIAIDARGAQQGVGPEIEEAVNRALKEYDKGNTRRVASGYNEAQRRRLIKG